MACEFELEGGPVDLVFSVRVDTAFMHVPHLDILTDDIRRDLEQLKDFSFQQHPRIHAEQERLDALSLIVRHKIELIHGSSVS